MERKRQGLRFKLTPSGLVLGSQSYRCASRVQHGKELNSHLVLKVQVVAKTKLFGFKYYSFKNGVFCENDNLLVGQMLVAETKKEF